MGNYKKYIHVIFSKWACESYAGILFDKLAHKLFFFISIVHLDYHCIKVYFTSEIHLENGLCDQMKAGILLFITQFNSVTWLKSEFISCMIASLSYLGI